MNKLATIPTTAELRQLEASWIESCHDNWGLVLMELAGKKSAELAKLMWQSQKGPVLVFCGRGNNGGDGLVIARYLSLWEMPFTVFMVEGQQKKPSEKRTESLINKEALERLGANIKTVTADTAKLKEQLTDASLIVDALLGTGLDRPLEGIYENLVNLINESGKQVLSIDIPSGINSDTGQIMGVAIKATQTVTFGYLKAGLLLFPGAEYVGSLKLVDIGLPEAPNASSRHLTTAEYVRNLLPKRPANSHKGTFGTVLSIAGSLSYRGAATLSSLTALRTGAGLSILATPKSIIPELNTLEIIYKGLAETKSASIASTALSELAEEINKAHALIVGPGLSMDTDTVQFVHKLLPTINKPCIIDADGLNAIAENTSIFPRNKEFVLTPHPKEFSRLTGMSVEDIQANRIESALKGARQFDCVIVLKGAHTIIANKDGRLFVNPTGNAGMATAGSGDVLSGIIGGLLAQGLNTFDAAVVGTYIHGLAGDIASQTIGETGFVAGEISSSVPHALTLLHDETFAGSDLEKSLF